MPVVTSARSDPTASLTTAEGIVGAAPAAQLTASRMGPGWSERRVASHVEVTVVSGTDLIDVKAKAATPVQASRLANTYAAAALELRGGQVQPAIRAALDKAIAQLDALGPTETPASTTLAARVTALAGLIGRGDPSLQLAAPARLAPRPGLAHALLTVLIALASGIVLGSLAWWFGTRVGHRAITTERRASELTGLPILGRLQSRLFLQGSGLGLASASGELRNALTLLELGERAPRTVAVVSPAVGDGKTSAATALARHLTERGRSVALLDLDWRKQDAFAQLGGEAGDASADRVRTPEGNRAALDPTPGAPTLLVSTSEGPMSADDIRRRIADASSAVDMVIVDTPALGWTRDALAAASLVQAVLLVVRLGHTPEHTLAEAQGMLARAGVRPVGVVVFTHRRSTRPRARELRVSPPAAQRWFARA